MATVYKATIVSDKVSFTTEQLEQLSNEMLKHKDIRVTVSAITS